jgi:hypothetical protein
VTVAQQQAINVRPIVECDYREVFIEPLSGNALTSHNIYLFAYLYIECAIL